MRRRLDVEMVRRGLAASRSEARDAIQSGLVTVAGSVATKAGTLVAADQPIDLTGASRRYASRGGDKLAPALERLGVEVAGRRCLDAGAGTGGFTDVLLEGGAEHVVAVDVGYGQFAWRLRTDPRVTLLERFNVRNLRPDDLPFAPDLVVADLSFISLVTVLPALAGAAAPDADFVLLVKPQFEAGRKEVGRGGVVSDPSTWASAVERVALGCVEAGIGPLAVAVSALRGPAGNVEFFLHARKGAEPRRLQIGDAVEEASRTVGERR